MEIHFGMALDGGGWPDLLHERSAVAGRVALGPAGLLDLLEVRLGLGGRAVPQALRTRQMLQRMEDFDDGDRFYSRSFRADPWACARTLLAWRDALVEGGWRPEADQGAQARLETLAELEGSGEPLAPGTADRLRAVSGALKDGPSTRITRLRLSEPLERLPPSWRDLLLGLKASGTRLIPASGADSNPRPSVTLLRGANEWACAVPIAAWLAAGRGEENGAVTLLCQGDTTALDHRLHRLGLPAPGRAGASPHRDWLQLLPLVIDNLWQPVRVEKLLELLLLPHTPVPRFAARILAEALCREPGLGGRAWQKALDRIAETQGRSPEQDGAGTGRAQEAGRELAADLDHWLRGSRLEGDRPVPAAAVRTVVGRVREHLDGIRWKTAAATLARAHCDDLLRVLEGLQRVDRPLLSRLLDEVLGSGGTGPQAREAAPWGVIGSPGQLTGQTGALIWWPCIDPQERTQWTWSAGELEALRAQGVALEMPEQRRLREDWWLRRLVARSGRLLLVLPERIAGETPRHHPVLDLLRYEFGLEVEQVDAAGLLAGSRPELAGRVLDFAPVEPAGPPAPALVRRTGPGTFRPPGEIHPSTLGDLFGCPFHWLLEQREIVAAGLQGLPTGNLATGTLAHRVLEEMFGEGLPATPATAARLAGEAFDRLLPGTDSELLLPENGLSRKRVRRHLTEAAADLVTLLQRLHIREVGLEQPLEGELEGVPLRGRADLVAVDHTGKRYLIDFKYSWGRTRYREAIAGGQDLQLIAYAHMLEPGHPTPVAYYLIPRRELITGFPDFAADATVEAPDPVQAWERLCRTWRELRALLEAGEVPVTGLMEKEWREKGEREGLIHLEPPCRYCAHRTLCGMLQVNDHG